MTRGAVKIIPEYFRRYINLIPEGMTVSDALDEYGIGYIEKERDKYKALGDQVYAPDKWTIKQILIHLIDTERIFAYRALRFARGDQNALPGMEQDDYVAQSFVTTRSIDNLIEEFSAVRKSTVCLFDSFEGAIWTRTGVASGKEVSVLALGFMICGHVVHHQNVINRLYYPILGLS